MSDQDENEIVNVSEVMTSGLLTNPSETALYKADDVKDTNLTLTIKGFQKRQFSKDGKTETAWIMVFDEGGPGLKLNLTRQEQLYSIMGTANIAEMVGRQIILAYDPDVKFGGRKVGGICLARAEDLVGR